MAKSEKELNSGMMDVLKKVKGAADKGAEAVLNGVAKFGSTVDRTAEAAVNKTKEMSTDAGKVKEDFKKINLKKPLE